MGNEQSEPAITRSKESIDLAEIGSSLLVVGWWKALECWNVTTLEKKYSLPLPCERAWDCRRLDDNTVAVSSWRSPYDIHLFHIGRNPAKLGTLSGHTSYVWRMCLVPVEGNEPLLVSGGQDATIRVWDIDRLECVEVVRDPTLPSFTSCNIQYDYKNQLVVDVTRDPNECRTFDLAKQTVVNRWKDSSNWNEGLEMDMVENGCYYVGSLSLGVFLYSPNVQDHVAHIEGPTNAWALYLDQPGNLLYTGRSDSKLDVYDVRFIHSLSESTPLFQIDLSKSTGGRTGSIYDIVPLIPPYGDIEEEKRIAVASDSHHIHLLKMRPGKQPVRFGGCGLPNSVDGLHWLGSGERWREMFIRCGATDAGIDLKFETEQESQRIEFVTTLFPSATAVLTVEFWLAGSSIELRTFRWVLQQ